MPEFQRRVTEIMHEYAGNRPESHFRQVTGFALSLYDQLQDRHRLEPRYRQVLWAAAMLHDVGTHSRCGSKPDPHAWRSADVILTRQIGSEQASPAEIATVASLHGIEKPDTEDGIGQVYQARANDLWGGAPLPPEPLLKLGAILRVADAFDYVPYSTVKSLVVRDDSVYGIPRSRIHIERATGKGRLLAALLGIHMAQPDGYSSAKSMPR